MMKENKISPSDLGKYLDLVEKVIASFGLDPMKTRMKKVGEWRIYKGKIPIWFYLDYDPFFKEYFFQVSGPIVLMPKENTAAFSKQLISLNSTLVEAAFMEKKGTVYINSVREIIQLDFEEARKIVRSVMNYTSFYHRAKANGLLNWPHYSSKDPSKPGPSSLS